MRQTHDEARSRAQHWEPRTFSMTASVISVSTGASTTCQAGGSQEPFISDGALGLQIAMHSYVHGLAGGGSCGLLGHLTLALRQHRPGLRGRRGRSESGRAKWKADNNGVAHGSDLVALPHEPGNDPAGCVVLVEHLGQLLASGIQMLLQGEGFEHDAVPLILFVARRGGAGVSG